MKNLFFIFSMILSALCNAQTVTEVIYPKYVQGVGTGNPPDDRKVPFACRMTINELTPNATYRYYSRFVQDPALATNGQGFYIVANQTGDFTRITSATLGVPGRFGEFTTDATGSATDWFIVEPSSAIDYQPGNKLYWRILMNNGAGGVSVVNRATATNPVTVLGFGSGSAEGTGIRSTPIPALTPKNFVFLYANKEGTGRPEAGTFVESDGTDNNAGANGYAPFYGNSVDGVDKTFGTIIPNNLSAGVRNISQYALASGALINSTTTTDGVFPTIPNGTVSTANTNTGLTEVVINGANVNFVTPPSTCNITLSSASTNVKCFGASTGAVNLTVTGAVAPVTYSWSNGATTQDLTKVPAGNYIVTVKDAVCTKTLTATVSQPAVALAASNTTSAILCNGDSSNIAVSATGGTAPYTGTGTFKQASGSKSYTVTDANGCTATTMVTVSQPAALVASSTKTAIVCGGSSTVVISATGGTAPYTGTGTFSQPAGSRTYSVTDANGCVDTVTVNVSAPSGPTATSSQSPVDCFGGTSTVTISATGGTTPYTGTGTFTQSAGSKSYTVTDANGCTSTITVTVTQPAQVPTPTISAVNNGNGTFTLTAGGYTGSLLWSTGETTPSIVVANAGTYTVTQTVGGCTSDTASYLLEDEDKTPTVSLTIPYNIVKYTGPARIKLNVAVTNEDTTITKVRFYSGTTRIHTEDVFPYGFLWDDVPVGTYTLTAKAYDDKGREITSNAIEVSVVDENVPPVVSIVSPVDDTTYTGPATIRLIAEAKDPNDRIHKVEFYEGTTLIRTENYFPYRYTWNNVQPGTYTITAKATDDKGLSATSDPVTVTVTSVAPIVRNRPSSSVNNKTDLNGALSLKLSPNPASNILNIYVKGLQQNKPLTISVVSALGVVVKTIQTTSNPIMQIDVSSLRSGVYFLKVLSGDKVLHTQFVKL